MFTKSWSRDRLMQTAFTPQSFCLMFRKAASVQSNVMDSFDVFQDKSLKGSFNLTETANDPSKFLSKVQSTWQNGHKLKEHQYKVKSRIPLMYFKTNTWKVVLVWDWQNDHEVSLVMQELKTVTAKKSKNLIFLINMSALVLRSIKHVPVMFLRTAP